MLLLILSTWSTNECILLSHNLHISVTSQWLLVCSLSHCSLALGDFIECFVKKIPACDYRLSLLIINQDWFRQWLGTVRQPNNHWGRVTHIWVSKLTIIGSDNGLSPGRRQAIIWTSAGILLIGPLGTHFSETLIKIYKFSFKKMRLKVSSAKRRPFCVGLNVLTEQMLSQINVTIRRH